MSTSNIIVLCTTPNITIAENLAATVVENHLAACVTILPGAISLYYWEKKIEKTFEVQMLLKTNLMNQKALLKYLKIHHPYKIPELLVLPIIFGDEDYLAWLNNFL